MQPEWKIDHGLVPYEAAVAAMEQRVAEIISCQSSELVWLLQHPPLYTAGSSASQNELKEAKRFPVFQTGRGGKYTYHGPGQRIGYVLADLRLHGQDLRAHICRLEEWVIRALGAFGIKGERREGRVGIWVQHPSGAEKKIAAIGVRVRKWVAFHGVAVNIAPDLTHFEGIVPCGLAEYGVTSLKDMGVDVSLEDFDQALKQNERFLFSS